MTADEIRNYAKQRADETGFPLGHSMRAIFMFELLVQDLAHVDSELSRRLTQPASDRAESHSHAERGQR